MKVGNLNIKAFQVSENEILRFLVRFNPADVSHAELLAAVRGVARSTGSEARNPKWTSYGALELDIFSPSKSDFDLFIAAVNPVATTEFVKDLNVAPTFKAESDLLVEARQLFNSERYWESHEVLEGIWRQKQGEEKRLLQAIILVCAAFVHHQKGENEVALSVMGRAERQLDFSARNYDGYDVTALRSKVRRVLEKRSFFVFLV